MLAYLGQVELLGFLLGEYCNRVWGLVRILLLFLFPCCYIQALPFHIHDMSDGYAKDHSTYITCQMGMQRLRSLPYVLTRKYSSCIQENIYELVRPD